MRRAHCCAAAACADRRKREEAARRAYLQRQAEGLIDSTAHEFQPVAKTAQFSVSDIYVVKRTAKLDENASETLPYLSHTRSSLVFKELGVASKR